MVRPVVPIVPYCLPPDRPLCHSNPDTEWARLFACFRLICRVEAIHIPHICSGWPENEQTVFAQWCHLKYAGMLDVYWKVKRCVNKAWRYFRCAASQNIELLSICHLISLFFFSSSLAFKSDTGSFQYYVNQGKKGKGREPHHTDPCLKMQNMASSRILN